AAGRPRGSDLARSREDARAGARDPHSNLAATGGGVSELLDPRPAFQPGGIESDGVDGDRRHRRFGVPGGRHEATARPRANLRGNVPERARRISMVDQLLAYL